MFFKMYIYDICKKQLRDDRTLTSFGCEGTSVGVDVFPHIIFFGKIEELANL